MPTPSQQGPADLTIEVSVRHGKTMTQHRLDESGTLTFRNRSDQALVIAARTCAPFVESGCGDAVSEFTIPPGADKTVRISEKFQEPEFVYSAQAGDAEPEDPIVIIDRR
jgi:hypothetical protein